VPTVISVVLVSAKTAQDAALSRQSPTSRTVSHASAYPPFISSEITRSNMPEAKALRASLVFTHGINHASITGAAVVCVRTQAIPSIDVGIQDLSIPSRHLALPYTGTHPMFVASAEPCGNVFPDITGRTGIGVGNKTTNRMYVAAAKSIVRVGADTFPLSWQVSALPLAGGVGVRTRESTVRAGPDLREIGTATAVTIRD
jgi:hypothetical protein